MSSGIVSYLYVGFTFAGKIGGGRGKEGATKEVDVLDPVVMTEYSLAPAV